MSGYGNAGFVLMAEQSPNIDDGNFYYVYLNRYYSQSGDALLPYRTAVNFKKYADGQEMNLGPTTVIMFSQRNKYNQGETMELRVVVDESIEIYVDGNSSPSISSSDDTFNSGTIGLLSNGVSVRFHSLGYKVLP